MASAKPTIAGAGTGPPNGDPTARTGVRLTPSHRWRRGVWISPGWRWITLGSCGQRCGQRGDERGQEATERWRDRDCAWTGTGGPGGRRRLRRGKVEKASTPHPTRFRAWRCPFSGLSPPSPVPTTDTSSLVRSNFYFVDTFRAPVPERCPSSVGRRRAIPSLPEMSDAPAAPVRGGRNGKPAPPLHARGERRGGAGRDPGRGATGAQPISVVCSGRTTTTKRSSPGWCHG